MKCVVNVKGYVTLKNFTEPETNGGILPFIAKDAAGVWVVNDYGNAIHVSFDHCEIVGD